ncbi:MAG: hypothetical protein JXA91_07335 [Candidatus Thermoplasmatota archaeon]|nr:hypothetical protein [Candidatus Thermoplasmatota archaeon]
MKEGYLQTKITEIVDKCKQLEQLMTMERSKIALLEERVGGAKELIKKLKNLETFKEQIAKELKSENQKLIDVELEKISKNVSKQVDKILATKSQDLDKTADYLKNKESEFKKQSAVLNDIYKEIIYLREHNQILMMKLVNKGILSDREVEETDRRSLKKAKESK